MSNKTRTLREIELHYLNELFKYDKVLQVTQLISLNQKGIKTDGRGVRGVQIFTKQTITAISLARIVPRPHSHEKYEYDFWDVGSVATLTRNLIEGYLCLYYFGLEQVTPEDAELRFLLLQLHRNQEWYGIRKDEMEADEIKQFESGIKEEKDRIRTNAYLTKLTKAQQERALRGTAEMYKSKSDFEDELTFCKGLKKYFRLLSNFSHPLPLSIIRTDNERGRGLGSDSDIGYCIEFITLARRYLAASTVGIGSLFPEQLGKKFENDIESILKLEN